MVVSWSDPWDCDLLLFLIFHPGISFELSRGWMPYNGNTNWVSLQSPAIALIIPKGQAITTEQIECRGSLSNHSLWDRNYFGSKPDSRIKSIYTAAPQLYKAAWQWELWVFVLILAQTGPLLDSKSLSQLYGVISLLMVGFFPLN